MSACAGSPMLHSVSCGTLHWQTRTSRHTQNHSSFRVWMGPTQGIQWYSVHPSPPAWRHTTVSHCVHPLGSPGVLHGLHPPCASATARFPLCAPPQGCVTQAADCPATHTVVYRQLMTAVCLQQWVQRAAVSPDSRAACGGSRGQCTTKGSLRSTGTPGCGEDARVNVRRQEL